MNFDKAEALRLKKVAESKIRNKDYTNARAKMMEAQQLFPGLENVSTMLTVLNILCAAEMEFPGFGIDWYWVLQIPPLASEEALNSQYHKLTSQLEPVKNKFPGVESALNLIKDAFYLLSDKTKRSKFDSMRNAGRKGCGNLLSQAPFDEVVGEKILKNETYCDNNEVDVRRELPSNSLRANNVNDHLSEPEIQHIRREWSANHFAVDQIWAVYDGPDDMPRQYVKVKEVVSVSKVCVNYLEPHPIHDNEIQWVEENLPFVCGTFRAGKTVVYLEMSKFSYLVECERSVKKCFYRIYPRKGEIWAMYRNWHDKWKFSDHKGYQCRVVEILSEFSEEDGICICSLVEVEGCLTFFQRQRCDGFELIRRLSRTEMLGFSHRIPAYTVPGIESYGIPKESWHLEPDALPPML